MYCNKSSNLSRVMQYSTLVQKTSDFCTQFEKEKQKKQPLVTFLLITCGLAI